jgi:conjugal transfer/entry exclusion protein
MHLRLQTLLKAFQTMLSTWLSSLPLLRLLQRLQHLPSLQQLVLRLQHLHIALGHLQQPLQRLHQSSIAYNVSLEQILSTSCLQSVLHLSQRLLSLQNVFQSLLHQLMHLLHLSLQLL